VNDVKYELETNEKNYRKQSRVFREDMGFMVSSKRIFMKVTR